MSSTPEERRLVRPFFFMLLGGLLATVGGIVLVILGLIGVLSGGWIGAGVAVALVGGVVQFVAIWLTLRRVPARAPTAAGLRANYRAVVATMGVIGVAAIVAGIVIGGTWLWVLGLTGLIGIGMALYWGFKYLGKRSTAILEQAAELAAPHPASVIVTIALVGLAMVGVLLMALSFGQAEPQLLFFLGLVTVVLTAIGLAISRLADDVFRRRRPKVSGLISDVTISCLLVLFSLSVILGGSRVVGALLYLVGAGSAVAIAVLWSRARNAPQIAG